MGSLTTVDRTIVLGDERVEGLPYRRLAYGPGNKLVVREDLAKAGAHRASQRIGLLAFGHLSDLHVVDSASPGRTSFIYQYIDASDGFPASARFRPQDLLTVQVLDAMIRKINSVGAGPLSGRPLDLAISTGDNSESRGTNEMMATIEAMNGEYATTDVVGHYEGIQAHGLAPDQLRRYIWHPEREPTDMPADDWKAKYGYPSVPGLLESALKPVRTVGINVPWYTGFGNHDALAHGGVPESAPYSRLISRLSVGSRLPLSLPEEMKSSTFWSRLKSATDTEMIALVESLPSRTVTASPLRAPFTKKEFISKHFELPGPHGPTGHGFDERNLADGTAYYRFDMASGVVGIMLDTTDPNGTAGAFLDRTQALWLEDQLKSVSRFSYTSSGDGSSSDAGDRLVVLFSHHPSAAFPAGEQLREDDDSETYLDRNGMLELLARFPNVILWVNGHMHVNRIWKHESPHRRGGLWEINTASHIDFPQQARVIEILDNGDGTLSIVAVAIDHSDAQSLIYDDEQTATSLAALSLELAINRPGLDIAGKLGTPKDRNVELLIPKPF